jgi:hypothetical protein
LSTSIQRRVVVSVAAGAAISLMAATQTANAVDQTIIIPEDQACPGFALQIDVTNNPRRVVKQFTDANGNAVRTIESGKGNDLVFTNLETGESVLTKSTGSVMKSTPSNTAETRSVVATGHNVIILFPTDIPAGPTTILYTGRVAYDVTPGETFTLRSVSGKTRDICAELA